MIAGFGDGFLVGLLSPAMDMVFSNTVIGSTDLASQIHLSNATLCSLFFAICVQEEIVFFICSMQAS